jgi:hypothetical protein
MHKQVAVYVALFSTLGLAIGWHFRNYRGAAGELSTRVKQIPGLRNARDRAAGVVTFLAVLFAVVLFVIAARHK